MDEYLKSFREMVSLRGLTDHTLISYTTYIKAYLEYLEQHLNKAPEDVTWEELRRFVVHIQQQRNLCDHTMNHCIKQLRFFTLYVLHKPWDPYQLPTRKFDAFLPYVPTRKEVFDFLTSISDLKLKTMASLMYSAGLRVGEVSFLKYQDIERKNMRIRISKSKNRCGRYAILSENMLTLLTDYWFAYKKPKGWLFTQPRNVSKPIYTQTISRQFNAHRAAGDFNPGITCHGMRRAFGTHLYEDGTDLLAIKALLGHKSIQSTTIYVSLASNGTSNTISPFDTLEGFLHD